MAKAFKARCPKPSLVGSHRLCVRYTGGWVEFSELWELNSRNHLKFGVKPEELVVGIPFLLDALNLNWLGVIGGPPLHGLW